MRLTPVIASRVLSDRTGEQVWLKCENLQRTGSFKPRGAYNRIANLSVISYEIVTKQHGGTIEVSSKVGDFTEFVVCLPRGLGAKGALTPST